MTGPGGPPPGAGSSDFDLGWALSGDGLLASLVSAAGRSRVPGRAYLTGLYLADVLTGLRPGGVMLACQGDTASWARLFGDSTGFIDIPLRGRHGVHCLVERERGVRPERRVTVVPLENGEMIEFLRGAGFTAAATAVDVTGNEVFSLIDPFGGAQDLAGGRLRAVPGFELAGSSAGALRAVELCSAYRLEPDGRTTDEITRSASRLDDLPSKAAWASLARLCSGGDLSEKARALRRFGVMEALLPEVTAEFDTPQNYYHHLGVWEHTLETLANLDAMLEQPALFFKAYGSRMAAYLRLPVEGGVDRKTFLAFAALVHDVGKPATMTVEKSGRIRFQGHQQEGALMARGIAARLGMGGRGSRRLAGIIGHHMRLGFLLKEGESAESRLRAVKEMGSLTLEVCMLSLADRLATRGEASSQEAIDRYTRMVNRVIADYFWDRDCPELLGGGEVVLHAGVEPGPGVGHRLFDLRVAQREGTVSSGRQALEFMAPDFKGRMR